MQNRTTIVTAHRLHTIMHAERIHVIEGGVVVESGLHEELLRRGGRYTSFYPCSSRTRTWPSRSLPWRPPADV